MILKINTDRYAMPFLLGYDSMHCCAEDVDDRDTHFLGGKWGLCTLKDI